jgi:putative transposase
MKFAFIHTEKAKLPATRLCRALGVSRSGYYAWSQRPPSAQAVADANLVPVIRACHVRSRGPMAALDCTATSRPCPIGCLASVWRV